MVLKAALAVLVAGCAPAHPAAIPTGALVEMTARAPLTVLMFFSAHCPCQSVHDARILALSRRYAARGVQFLAIDSEIDATAARDSAEAEKRHYPFSIVTDPGAKIATAIGAEFATYTVVVDRGGVIRYRGGIDSDRTHLTESATPYLSDALDALLAGHTPRVAEAKALGCALETR